MVTLPVNLGHPDPQTTPNFAFCVAFHISVVAEHREFKNLVCMLTIASPSLRTTNCPWKRSGHGHVASLCFGK